MNVCYLIGRAGADPELRYTPNKTPVLNFSLATSEKKGEGFETHWHRITVYGTQADNMAQRIRKGSEVFISGKIYPRVWEDKSGNKRSNVDIIANWIRVIDSGKSTQPQPQSPDVSQFMNENDIPF